MKRSEIVNRVARRTGLTRAQAADSVDRMVSEILTSLRLGREAVLPGLGRFVSGPRGVISFEPERKQ